jgi:hypothetical protein
MTGPCEQLLDYVYGELDEAGKRAFEEHLKGCARCQADVASFGKVRTATKRLLPSVEPTGPLPGALHAQLMHAAAQHKPRRGVLLAFPRKIVQHPAWAAAAMFAIVGSALALNWSRGKLEMAPASAPDKTVDAPEVPAAEPALGTPAPAQPAAVAGKVEEKAKDEVERAERQGAVATVAKDGKQNEPRIEVEMLPAGRMTVQRPALHRAAATGAPLKVALPAAPPPSLKKVAPLSGLRGGAVDDAVVLDGTRSEGYANGGARNVRGAENTRRGGENAGSANNLHGDRAKKVRGAEDTPGRGGDSLAGETSIGSKSEAAPKSSAPESLARTRQRDQAEPAHAASDPAPMTASTTPAHGEEQVVVKSSPAPDVEANSAPVLETRVPTYREQYRAPLPLPKPVQAPSQQSKDVDALHKRFLELATSGHYEEAIKLFQELEKRTAFITPQERAQYVHCLTAVGREEQAQQQLDDLKNSKRATNAQLQEVESELMNARKHSAQKKTKKARADQPAAAEEPAPPARSAAPAQAAPAQAAPSRARESKQKAY